MADPYLEDLEIAFRGGIRDLHEAAEVLHIPFEAICLTFNNGLLKGYWRIVLADESATAAVPPSIISTRE